MPGATAFSSPCSKSQVWQAPTLRMPYSDLCAWYSFHYWRIHPQYWEDRLKRGLALGLNTIQASGTATGLVSTILAMVLHHVL